MGMMDWIDGEDEETLSDNEGSGVATDGLGFDEDMDDLSDDFGEFDDDGDFDDGDFGDDEFGGGGGGGGSVDPNEIAELEDRVSELENELSATSSSINTVREENKQIGETVEELDDTIRKLLDIYEMVTRGINPFVDDAREMGGLEGGGSFGLFDAEEEEEEEHLDPDVASADAESFFDEDFGELDADADAEEAELAAEDELAESEREGPAEALDDEDGDDAETSDSGGSSFDDLKAEYEGDEGWDEEDVDDGPLDTDDLAVGDEDVPTTEELVGDEDDAEDEEDVDDPAEESSTEEMADEATETAAVETDTADPDPAEASEPDAAETGAFEFSESDDDAQQTTESDAYLTTLPASYVAESVALEWTRFLVSVGGAIGAARALRQYRQQEWITRDVEKQMNAHVRNAAASTTADQPRDLRVEHHKESLTYISRLAGDVAESRLLEELSHRGGESRGIRR